MTVVSADPPSMTGSTQKLETQSTLKRKLNKVDGVLFQVDQLVFVFFFWAI